MLGGRNFSSYINFVFVLYFILRKEKMTNQHNPYQPPVAYEATDVDDVEYSYAGFWIRVVATIIDTVLLMLVIFPIAFALGFMGFSDSESFGAIDVATQLITFALYIWLWVKFAGTPGHRLLKLKILDADTGKNLSIGKAVIRYIGYIISALVLCIGFVWVVFDARKQGWHDKMANSVVVKEL